MAKKEKPVRSMQDKLMETLRDKVENGGLEFVQNARFGNMGTVYVQPKDSFRVAFAFAYSFQDDHASFQVYPEGEEVVGGMIGTRTKAIGDFDVRYARSEQVAEFLLWIDHAIAKRGKVERKGGTLRHQAVTA